VAYSTYWNFFWNFHAIFHWNFHADKISWNLTSLELHDACVQAVSPQVTVSHPSGSRLPLLSARLAVTSPAAEHQRPLAGTKLYCLVTEARRCEQLAHVYCVQTARWIKMPLSMKVGFGPGQIVLDGDPALPLMSRCLCLASSHASSIWMVFCVSSSLSLIRNVLARLMFWHNMCIDKIKCLCLWKNVLTPSLSYTTVLLVSLL